MANKQLQDMVNALKKQRERLIGEQRVLNNRISSLSLEILELELLQETTDLTTDLTKKNLGREFWWQQVREVLGQRSQGKGLKTGDIYKLITTSGARDKRDFSSTEDVAERADLLNYNTFRSYMKSYADQGRLRKIHNSPLWILTDQKK